VSKQFERAAVKKLSAAALARVVRAAQGVRSDLRLDAKRGSAVQVGDRRWVFVLTKEAVEAWKVLGSKEMTLGVLIYEHSGAAAPYAHRELLVRPRRGSGMTIEVWEGGRALWSGKASLTRTGQLQFSMPVTRKTSTAKGVMAGRVTSRGKLTLTAARLPRPVRKKTPKLSARD
jgi:hypothetical protein